MNTQFKMQLRQKAPGALSHLRTLFTQFDTNGNGKLDLKEFEKALGQYGFFPSVNDLKQLHAYYDKDGDGMVCY